MFIAEILYRGQLREGPPHETREGAIRALITLRPEFGNAHNLPRISTSVGYQDGGGLWRTIGRDSQAIGSALAATIRAEARQ